MICLWHHIPTEFTPFPNLCLPHTLPPNGQIFHKPTLATLEQVTACGFLPIITRPLTVGWGQGSHSPSGFASSFRYYLLNRNPSFPLPGPVVGSTSSSHLHRSRDLIPVQPWFHCSLLYSSHHAGYKPVCLNTFCALCQEKKILATIIRSMGSGLPQH